MNLSSGIALPVITYLWVFALSLLSGLATYFNRLTKNDPLKRPVMVLVLDIIYCQLAGLITYFLAVSAGADSMMTAALVSAGSHMGARLVFTVESLVINIIEIKKNKGEDL
ncbi:MAG: phage holin family protein [Methylococcaceae bacterium]|jgi:type IV secretory pathway VirB3-like protein